MNIADRLVLYIIFSCMLFVVNGGFVGIVFLWIHFAYKFIEYDKNISKWKAHKKEK